MRSYEVREGPNNPAGWVPGARVWRDYGQVLEVQPLSLPNRIVGTREEADGIAREMVRDWIDRKGLG